MSKNKKKLNKNHSPKDDAKAELDSEISEDEIEADDTSPTLDSENGDSANENDETVTRDEDMGEVDANDEVDDGEQDEVLLEPDGDGGVEPKAKAREKIALIDKTYTRRLYLSLIAALIGASFAMIPVMLCAYWFGTVFYPFFIIAPLLIYVLNIIFDGCGDIRTLAISAVFSLMSAFASVLACRVLTVASNYGYSITSLPASFYGAFGESGFFPKSASMYIYPLLFTALGLTATWELLRFDLRKRVML